MGQREQHRTFSAARRAHQHHLIQRHSVEIGKAQGLSSDAADVFQRQRVQSQRQSLIFTKHFYKLTEFTTMEPARFAFGDGRLVQVASHCAERLAPRPGLWGVGHLRSNG